MASKVAAYKNPVGTFRRAVFDFPMQLLLILIWGSILSTGIILVLHHAPTVVAWARDLFASA